MLHVTMYKTDQSGRLEPWSTRTWYGKIKDPETFKGERVTLLFRGSHRDPQLGSAALTWCVESVSAEPPQTPHGPPAAWTYTTTIIGTFSSTAWTSLSILGGATPGYILTDPGLELAKLSWATGQAGSCDAQTLLGK